MPVGTLLSLASILAMIAYVSEAKGFSPVGPSDAWRALTEPLRDVHRVLPPLAVIPAWFIGLWLANFFGSGFLAFALFVAFPVALVYETIRVGIPFAIGSTLGLLTGLTGDVTPDRDNFALPLNVYKSADDDISEWTDGAMHVPRRTTLALGASGSGKSETLKHFASQLRSNPNEPVVVFDMKRDYQDFLEERGASIIRLSSEGSQTELGNSVAWNIFRDMENEQDADEIARALFPDSRSSKDFFDTAGRQLFAANLKYLNREIDDPTNADLIRYWQRATPEKMYENLTRDGHEDLRAAASAINPDADGQTAGVFASAQQQVQDLFVGDFAKEGYFSIREYMANPQGRILVLDYPTRPDNRGLSRPYFGS